MAKVTYWKGNKIVTEKNGEQRIYRRGECIDISKPNQSGKRDHYKVNNGGLLGLFGPWKGEKKK